MSYPAIGAFLNHSLSTTKSHVCREKATEYEDRPLTNKYPCCHKRQANYEHGPAADGNLSHPPLCACEPAENASDDADNDGYKGPRLQSGAAPVNKSASEAHGQLPEREQTEKEPEGKLGSRLLVEGRVRGDTHGGSLRARARAHVQRRFAQRGVISSCISRHCAFG